MLRKFLLFTVALLAGSILFQMSYGGSPGEVLPKGRFDVVAHRGVHTNWKKGTYDRRTGCEAKHIYTPNHTYIENTLESIGAAFEMGATIVEIDTDYVEIVGIYYEDQS